MAHDGRRPVALMRPPRNPAGSSWVAYRTKEESMSQHSFVLSRRVRRAPEAVERTLLGLAPGDYAGLTLLSPFERRAITGPWGTGPPDRQAAAELMTGP